MGRATIVSGGTNGQYQINYKVDKTRMQARIDAIAGDIQVLTEVEIPKLEADVAEKQTNYNNWLVRLNSAISLKKDTTEITEAANAALRDLNVSKDRLNESKLRLASLKQEKKYLTDNFPSDQQISAWCADMNQNLSGEVGTIEIPGERTAPVIIKPGGSNGSQAAYNSAADGQIVPILGQSPTEAFYNLAMMPGWQKYQPTYRLGTITNLNGNLCDVLLDPAKSSLQNLDVNQATTLTNVPITYLTCDGAAFSINDRVVVKYSGSGPGTPYTPSVIGFESNPKICLNQVTPVSVEFMLESLPPDGITWNHTAKIWNESGIVQWTGVTSSNIFMASAQPSFTLTVDPPELIISQDEPYYYGAELNYVSGSGSISMPDRDGGVAAYIFNGVSWVTGDHNLQANFIKTKGVSLPIWMGAEKPTIFPPTGEGVDILSSSMPVASVGVKITPTTLIPSPNFNGETFI